MDTVALVRIDWNLIIKELWVWEQLKQSLTIQNNSFIRIVVLPKRGVSKAKASTASSVRKVRRSAVVKPWLESILAELKGVTEEQVSFAEPDEEPDPQEHVVGVASVDLRQLFFVFKQYMRRVRQIAADITVSPKSQRDELMKEGQRFHTQANLIKDIFWVSCRAAFPELWDKSSIGIRKGWQVVWSDPEERSRESALEVLDALIGIGEMFEGRAASGAAPDRSGLN